MEKFQNIFTDETAIAAFWANFYQITYYERRLEPSYQKCAAPVSSAIIPPFFSTSRLRQMNACAVTSKETFLFSTAMSFVG